jgi:hypothetical protein
MLNIFKQIKQVIVKIFEKPNPKFTFNFSNSEYKKCKNNISYFIENYIRRTDTFIQNDIKLRFDQKEAIKSFQNQNVLLKSTRGSGKTMVLILFAICKAIFNPGTKIRYLSFSWSSCHMARISTLNLLKPWMEFVKIKNLEIDFYNGSSITFTNKVSPGARFDHTLVDEYSYFDDNVKRDVLNIYNEKISMTCELDSYPKGISGFRTLSLTI